MGDNELLLVDSVRYAERTQAAGGEVTLSVWERMPHVFQSSLDSLAAAARSVDAIGAFLSNRLGPPAGNTLPSTPLKGA